MLSYKLIYVKLHYFSRHLGFLTSASSGSVTDSTIEKFDSDDNKDNNNIIIIIINISMSSIIFIIINDFIIIFIFIFF